MPIVIYGRDNSYNVQKVLWLLEELNLKFKQVQVGSKAGDTEKKEFIELNPMKKVPVLVDDQTVIWESNTILRYLAQTYGKSSSFKGTDPYHCSLYERWMDWSQSVFTPAFDGVFWGGYRTPEHLQNLKKIEDAKLTCNDCLKKLNEQLENNNYLIGSQLSLADICCGIFLYRLKDIELDINFPNKVEKWYSRLQLSKGYQKWVMKDFSELKGRLQY